MEKGGKINICRLACARSRGRSLRVQAALLKTQNTQNTVMTSPRSAEPQREVMVPHVSIQGEWGYCTGVIECALMVLAPF